VRAAAAQREACHVAVAVEGVRIGIRPSLEQAGPVSKVRSLAQRKSSASASPRQQQRTRTRCAVDMHHALPRLKLGRHNAFDVSHFVSELLRL
jgi:hypothetical protein